MYRILLILFANYSFIMAQVNEPLLKITFNVLNGNISKELSVGIDETATDGIDAHLGEGELPPLPPSGAFDVRLVGTNIGIPLSNGSLKDYRYGNFPFSQTLIHEINIQRGLTDSIIFSWNLPEGVNALLQDFFGGIVVNETLNGTGNYVNTNPLISDLKLTINYNVISEADEENIFYNFQLFQNYPNPFNPFTKIKFQIPEKSNVRLDICNILGQVLFELVNEELDAGYHEKLFDASDLSTGVYIYRIQAGSFVSSKKMTLIK